MFGIIKKMFIVLLVSIVNWSNHKKCVSLSNKNYKIQPTILSNKICVPSKREDLMNWKL